MGLPLSPPDHLCSKMSDKSSSIRALLCSASRALLSSNSLRTWGQWDPLRVTPPLHPPPAPDHPCSHVCPHVNEILCIYAVPVFILVMYLTIHRYQRCWSDFLIQGAVCTYVYAERYFSWTKKEHDKYHRSERSRWYSIDHRVLGCLVSSSLVRVTRPVHVGSGIAANLGTKTRVLVGRWWS
jgi:hypothetical protein